MKKMINLISGKITQFALLILSFIAIYMSIQRSVSGKVPQLRRLPAVDAIDEALGRAVEMGKTVVFTHGTGKLETSNSAGSLAAIATLPYVARRTAELDLEMFLPTGSHTAYNVLGEVMRESAIMEGKPELYNPNNVRYLSEVSRAYSAGVMSILMTRPMSIRPCAWPLMPRPSVMVPVMPWKPCWWRETSRRRCCHHWRNCINRKVWNYGVAS